MKRVRRYFTTLALSAALVIAGCADAPTSPETVQTPEPNASLLGNLLNQSQQVMVVERVVPLAADEVRTQTIGQYGGFMHLPQAGLSIFFPPGAVSSPTQITATAPAGNLVGYHFAPHGLQFNSRVIVVQDMTKANVGLLSGLMAAYFQGPLQPTVTALEVLPLTLLQQLNLGIFRIEHFSGYVIATD